MVIIYSNYLNNYLIVTGMIWRLLNHHLPFMTICWFFVGYFSIFHDHSFKLHDHSFIVWKLLLIFCKQLDDHFLIICWLCQDIRWAWDFMIFFFYYCLIVMIIFNYLLRFYDDLMIFQILQLKIRWWMICWSFALSWMTVLSFSWLWGASIQLCRCSCPGPQYSW